MSPLPYSVGENSHRSARFKASVKSVPDPGPPLIYPKKKLLTVNTGLRDCVQLSLTREESEHEQLERGFTSGLAVVSSEIMSK